MKLVKLALFTTLAMALSWAENFILPISVIPGFKIGFANIVTIIVFKLYGIKNAYAVVFVRCILSAFMYGGIASFPYSFFGGMAAITAMYFADRVPGVNYTGMAIAGAFFHNLAQVTVAVVIMNNIYIYSYMGMLGLVSVVVGTFTGITAQLILNRIKTGGMYYEK